MAKAGRRYSAKLKFQVVVEALKGEKSPAQIAKAYRVHPNSVGLWKRWFLERGPQVFAQAELGGEQQRRVAELEQLLAGPPRVPGEPLPPKLRDNNNWWSTLSKNRGAPPSDDLGRAVSA